MQAATDAVRPLVPELFEPHPVEVRLAAAGVAVDPAALRAEFEAIWSQVLTAATLRPAPDGDASRAGTGGPGGDVSRAGVGGRYGNHTAALPEILAELQALARSMPGGVW
jgi:ring-1,2-phenylacetyl-CoA epoxidase subunit PaaC